MCGGVGFSIEGIDEEELRLFFTLEEIELFRSSGMAKSHFWDREPVLPVRNVEIVNLYSWGNRDRSIKLPLTGWARSESIADGKWEHLSPQEISIPVLRGREKGIWFDTCNTIKGIKIAKSGLKKVYMVTKDASPIYKKITGHDREPYWETA